MMEDFFQYGHRGCLMVFHRMTNLRNFPVIPPAVLFGAGVVGTITFSYMMLTRMSLMGGIMPKQLLEAFVLGIPAVGLLYAGFWLATGDFTPTEIWQIGSYAIAGVAVSGVGVSLGLLAISVPGLGLREAFFLFISTGTEGAFFGVLLGVVRVTDLLHEDITEQKQQQEQLAQENERLEMFARIVSHDLRNPLNVAQGRLELARKECDNEHLEDVERAHERMETLIEDLLVLAQQGETVTDPESVNLDEVVEVCWSNVQTPDATISSDIEQTIKADQGRLQQLLENLFRNAIEHGGEDVAVQIGSLDDGFYVEDDGSGILKNNRDVFDAGYSTSDDGTGFGLNIVEQIAEAHDWQICITEGSEGGARFEITDVEFVAAETVNTSHTSLQQ
jgi:signal transduction histidine kinase